MKYFLITTLIISCPFMPSLRAQNASYADSLSLRLHFRQGIGMWAYDYLDNQENFIRFSEQLRQYAAARSLMLSRIEVKSATSPEGLLSTNNRLVVERSESMRRLVHASPATPDIYFHRYMSKNDWTLLRQLLSESSIPYRKEALKILDAEALNAESDSAFSNLKRELSRLHGGRIWDSIYTQIFPLLRYGELKLYYNHLPPMRETPFSPTEFLTSSFPAHLPLPGFPYPDVPNYDGRKPLYMLIKTSLLHDALLIPHVGAEIAIGCKWSVGAQWWHSWWWSDRTHWYHRTYGGDLELRYWPDVARGKKPFTGHHFGLYGGILTYDFEWGARGYLADRWSFFGGLSYGYSLPISRRMNLDFTIGLGYLGGIYKEYLPKDDCYVWQATKNRQWIGPTKAEVSLVWLIGHKNENPKKGGRR